MKNNKKASASLRNDKSLHKNLNFTATEQYKLLRTNILFTLPSDIKCPVIGISSSTVGEGKSTTAINLAYVIAESGSRVLLIDGDLRLPSIAKKMKIKSVPGLTGVLINSKIDIEVFKSSLNENWYILPSGELPPNPSELLGSKRMEKMLDMLREQFDYIIIDLPPVNVVSDAISLSAHLSGMIIVVRENYVTKNDLDQCLRQLEFSNVKILGFVMNECADETAKGSKYRKGKYSRYYYRYQDYGTNEEDR